MTPGLYYPKVNITPFTFTSFYKDECKRVLYFSSFISQENNDKDYAVDTFWLENIQFKKKIDNLSFSSLFEVRETANGLYSLALECNLGQKVKDEFIEKIKFINYLLENLGHEGHGIALQRLKDRFGGRKGMSARSKEEADKIIRESLKGNALQVRPTPQHFPQFGPVNPMPLPFQMGPFNAPQFPFGFQQQHPQQRGVNGPCFVCQQYGHVARNCPTGQTNPRGGNSRRGNQHGRGNSGS